MAWCGGATSRSAAVQAGFRPPLRFLPPPPATVAGALHQGTPGACSDPRQPSQVTLTRTHLLFVLPLQALTRTQPPPERPPPCRSRPPPSWPASWRSGTCRRWAPSPWFLSGSPTSGSCCAARWAQCVGAARGAAGRFECRATAHPLLHPSPTGVPPPLKNHAPQKEPHPAQPGRPPPARTQALLRGVGSWGGFCAKQPLATFCPCTLAGRHSLEVRWRAGLPSFAQQGAEAGPCISGSKRPAAACSRRLRKRRARAASRLRRPRPRLPAPRLRRLHPSSGGTCPAPARWTRASCG